MAIRFTGFGTLIFVFACISNLCNFEKNRKWKNKDVTGLKTT